MSTYFTDSEMANANNTPEGSENPPKDDKASEDKPADVSVGAAEGESTMEQEGTTATNDTTGEQAKSNGTAVTGDGTADAPMEIVDGDDGEAKHSTTATPVVVAPQVAPTIIFQPSPIPAPIYPGGFPIDVFFEASKLPLDVAIFNSARASGGDEKIRKYLQAVLVIGGTALTPGMAHALESR